MSGAEDIFEELSETEAPESAPSKPDRREIDKQLTETQQWALLLTHCRSRGGSTARRAREAHFQLPAASWMKIRELGLAESWERLSEQGRSIAEVLAAGRSDSEICDQIEQDLKARAEKIAAKRFAKPHARRRACYDAAERLGALGYQTSDTALQLSGKNAHQKEKIKLSELEGILELAVCEAERRSAAPGSAE